MKKIHHLLTVFLVGLIIGGLAPHDLWVTLLVLAGVFWSMAFISDMFNEYYE